nr:esterase PIR7B-like [Coffea arabica]
MAAFNRFLVGLVIVFLAYSPSSSALHFLLIHGSGHGGHNVTALDLAYSGRNQVPLERVHTIDEYHKPLSKDMKSLSPEDKLLPRPDQLDDSFVIGDPIRIVLIGPHFAATLLYQNSPPEDLKLANYSLRLTQFFYGDVANRQIRVTKERYGSVPRAYVIDLEDKLITPEAQRLMIARTPPQVVRQIRGQTIWFNFLNLENLPTI